MTRVVVVSGLSGSGKTLAVKSLEDMGFFSVDNLPIPLILPFVELLERSDDSESRGAFVVDVRERGHLESIPDLLETLRSREAFSLFIVYLEAQDETLVRRFSTSRRPHPLAHDGTTLAAAIKNERELLVPLRSQADRVISTDELSPHDLRRLIKQSLEDRPGRSQLQCEVVSFGFKYGGARDADMVFDARFLDNPYFHPQLKPLSGKDRPVREFLEALPEYREFFERVSQLISFVVPRFVHEGKSYLTIAIGCTGGRHRSVAISEALGEHVSKLGVACNVTHRDLEKEEPAPPAGAAKG